MPVFSRTQMSSKNEENQCVKCQASTQATIWCGNCNRCYCSSCSNNVHEKRAFSNHQLLPIAQRLPASVHCSLHDGEELKYWCSDDNELICGVCVNLEHRNHKCEFFKHVCNKKCAELDEQLQLMQSYQKHHLENIQNYAATASNKKVDISKPFAHLRAKLNELEEQLQEGIDKIEQTNQREIEAHYVQLNDIREQIDYLAKLLEEVRSTNNPINILQEYKPMRGTIQVVEQELQRVRLPSLIECEVKGMDQLCKIITDFIPKVTISSPTITDSNPKVIIPSRIKTDPNPDVTNSSQTIIDSIPDVTNPGKQVWIPDIPVDAQWSKNGVTSIDGLNRPFSLAFDDRNDTVFVADHMNHRIVAKKPDGNEQHVVAGGNEKGNGLHQLNSPSDVLIDKGTNSIIICDAGNRRVMRWPLQNGTTEGEMLIENIDCWGLAMDTEGVLYVTDWKKHEVKQYFKGSTAYTVVAGGNGEGAGLHQLNYPYYVAVDDKGTIYVSDSKNHRVMKWMKDAKEGIVIAGAREERRSRANLRNPRGIVVDTKGTFYVVDTDNHRVTRWCQETNQYDIIVGGNGRGKESHQLNSPFALSFDGHGHLYVADTGNNRVQRFSIE